MIERSKIKDLALRRSGQRSKRNEGFTLLELIIVFAIISIMVTLGIAAFVDYNRAQTLNVAALEVVATLNLAKSRAQSQVKPEDCRNTLNGYKVGICSRDALKCKANTNSKIKYAFYADCSNENFVSFANTNKTLPTDIIFDSTSTNITSIFFPVLTGGAVLTGGVNGSGRIVLSGYGKTKTITIDSSGNINSN